MVLRTRLQWEMGGVWTYTVGNLRRDSGGVSVEDKGDGEVSETREPKNQLGVPRTETEGLV